MDAREAWRRTLLEWEAVRHYHTPYMLVIGKTFRNPLVERFLPSVVLVKAVAAFDLPFNYKNYQTMVFSPRLTRPPFRPQTL